MRAACPCQTSRRYSRMPTWHWTRTRCSMWWVILTRTWREEYLTLTFSMKRFLRNGEVATQWENLHTFEQSTDSFQQWRIQGFPDKGGQPIIWLNFSKNYMEIKKIWPRGGAPPQFRQCFDLCYCTREVLKCLNYRQTNALIELCILITKWRRNITEAKNIARTSILYSIYLFIWDSKSVCKIVPMNTLPWNEFLGC